MLGYNFPHKSTRISKDYEITQISLGNGISGKVLKCIHKSSGKQYALKILGDDAKSRREIELHYRGRECPNIVKIIDIYENNNSSTGRNHFLVVLECMEGGELFTRIHDYNQRGFTEQDAAGLVYQICTAIAYLHKMNIAHRDLKPENLLFSSDAPDATLKLIDFGFAKETLPGQPLKSPCFTPYYVAPEVIGTTSYDMQCDLWSLGVITYILLCGYPPFYSQGGDPISPGMKTRIRNGQYTFPTNEWHAVSEEAKDLIRRLLIVEPEKRLTIDKVMHHTWIARHQYAPKTPLLTASVLSQERNNWVEIKDSFSNGLQTMRTESTAPQLKSLKDSSNKLYRRRLGKTRISPIVIDEP